MRKIAVAIFLTLFVASPVAAAGQSGNAAQAPSADARALGGIDALVEKSLKDFQVPGAAISIVKDGRVILSKGYGLRDPVTRAPMTDRTIFPIASISKGFTSLAAEMLVSEGKLSLDVPVSDYLLGFRSKDPTLTLELTLRDMLSHRSGMISYDVLSYRNAGLTREDLLSRLPYLDVTYPIRTRFKYNNTMFALAGLTLERVSGEPFESLIERRILKPLEMNDSFYGYDRAVAAADHTSGVVADGKGWKVVPPFRASLGLSPPGGIYSNARDLANWMLFQLDQGQFQGRQIAPASIFPDMRKLHIASTEVSPDPERTPLGYGLGWFIDELRGHRMIQHGGALTGSPPLRR